MGTLELPGFPVAGQPLSKEETWGRFCLLPGPPCARRAPASSSLAHSTTDTVAVTLLGSQQCACIICATSVQTFSSKRKETQC